MATTQPHRNSDMAKLIVVLSYIITQVFSCVRLNLLSLLKFKKRNRVNNITMIHVFLACSLGHVLCNSNSRILSSFGVFCVIPLGSVDSRPIAQQKHVIK